jgi:hypothetical protein
MDQIRNIIFCYPVRCLCFALAIFSQSCSDPVTPPASSRSSSKTDEIAFYFKYAQERVREYSPRRKDYVIVIDYRKNILADRLIVLDMRQKKAVLSSRVAHAWRSGAEIPVDFSNEVNSLKSSKGNFVTTTSYTGTFGYSMNVKGLDPGINDNAYERRIVFHSDQKMTTKWSWGCFATPEASNKKLIDLTKNGVLVCVIV